MSNKQRLQVNNTNLSTVLSKIGDLPLKALVEAAAREGQYVWKKLTAEGGTFSDYVVNDSETAYPDGGMKDGYWYEMPKPASSIPDLSSSMMTAFGYTQKAVDKFTYATDQKLPTSSPGLSISHTLGAVPKAFIIAANSIKTTGTGYGLIQVVHGGKASISTNTLSTTCAAVVYQPGQMDRYKLITGNGGASTFAPTSSKIYLYRTTSVMTEEAYFPAGVEYTLITMA